VPWAGGHGQVCSDRGLLLHKMEQTPDWAALRGPLVEQRATVAAGDNGECGYHLRAVLAPRLTPNFQEWRVVQVC